MSRYIILLLLNIPFATLAILGIVVNYKLRRVSYRQAFWSISIWIIVLVGLAMSEQIYVWLFDNDLTKTEPLSLFDVVQITGLVILGYVLSKTGTRVTFLEGKISSLHRRVSVLISSKDK